ncbi:MAG: integration host factor subunit beta [Candidatus Eutrophobiaceae bacterium]
MTRSKLIKALFDQSNQLKQKDIELAIKIILEQMSDTLANGQRIEIRGFGSFSLRHHAARIGRNPRSSQPVRIAAKYVPHFKPGKSLRDRVNQTPLPKKDPPSP